MCFGKFEETLWKMDDLWYGKENYFLSHLIIQEKKAMFFFSIKSNYYYLFRKNWKQFVENLNISDLKIFFFIQEKNTMIFSFFLIKSKLSRFSLKRSHNWLKIDYLWFGKKIPYFSQAKKAIIFYCLKKFLKYFFGKHLSTTWVIKRQ